MAVQLDRQNIGGVGGSSKKTDAKLNEIKDALELLSPDQSDALALAGKVNENEKKLSELEDAIDDITAGIDVTLYVDVVESTLSLAIKEQTANTTYRCGVLSSLELTEVASIHKEVNVYFSTGDSVENQLTIPADTKYVGDLSLEANSDYILSVYEGVIVLGKIEKNQS